MNWKEEPVLYVDTETTGIDPEKDRVVEIAMALMLRDEVRWSYQTLINPEMPIPEGAASVHKIHDEDVVDAPTFADLMELFGLCMDYRICGAYNAPYDKTIIAHEFQRCGVDFDKPFWVDSLVLARNFITIRGKGVHKLENICKRLGIELGEAAHTAAADAIAAGMITNYYMAKLPDDLDEYAKLQTGWAKAQRAEWENYCKRVGRDPGKSYL